MTSPMNTIFLPADCSISNAQRLCDELLQHSNTESLIIDGSSVERIDCSALQLLLGATSNELVQIRPRLVNASDAVVRSLKLAGLTQLLESGEEP